MDKEAVEEMRNVKFKMMFIAGASRILEQNTASNIGCWWACSPMEFQQKSPMKHVHQHGHINGRVTFWNFSGFQTWL